MAAWNIEERPPPNPVKKMIRASLKLPAEMGERD